jgi:translation initiation factor IF-3
LKKLNNLKKPRINNEIKSAEVRVLDENGKNIGVFGTREAQAMAKEKELDLIEISPKASPPIAKIMDFGKYMYLEKKKEREASKNAHEQEMRNVRIHLGTSIRDLSLKAKKVDEFLRDGDRVRVELFLKGREKYLDKDFLKERLERILNLISEQHKVLQEVKKGPRGIATIIERTK